MTAPIAPGRRCGACTLCCKVLSIEAFAKPKGKWCGHCAVGKGCKIYSDRPEECRTFSCGYLQTPELGEEWLPAHSKIVLVSELNGKRIAAHVDPGRPAAWREEPYYSILKGWARVAATVMDQVIVQIGYRAIVILPDEDVDLGEIGDDERIVTGEVRTPFGPRLRAMKMRKDDPRIAGQPVGTVFTRAPSR